jgi:hypothetical protein
MIELKQIERPEYIRDLSNESIIKAIQTKIDEIDLSYADKINYQCFKEIFEYLFELESQNELLKQEVK